jgi:endonuclease/exonuclease/phosphatase family metal-dependent hydrolase
MPFYRDLHSNTATGKRTIEKLLQLRSKMDMEIPSKTAEKTLLLATWNIREFDSPAYGERIPEAMYYIAEIIARFDLVAIQEVRQDLGALHRLMELLGSDWDHMVSDVTEGTRGNGERTAFVFDKRKIKPGGLVGNLVLPPLESTGPNGKRQYLPVSQIVRTPLIAGFKTGWTDFILTTVHIIYGEGIANSPARIEEIRQVAQALKRRSENLTDWSRNLILLGDFNIFDTSDLTMKEITNAGFVIPPQLQELPSNALKDKFYDQIAFRIRPDRFGTTGKAGVFDFFDTVFRKEDEALYISEMGTRYFKNDAGEVRKNPSQYYRTYWRTHQMSDHLPMWVELKIDFSDEFLTRKLSDSNS